MSYIPKKGVPIARIVETQSNGKTRQVGIQYRWTNGSLTKMYTVAKKDITGSISTLEIGPEEIAENKTAA